MPQEAAEKAVQKLLEGSQATRATFLDQRLHKQRKRAAGANMSRQWYTRESDWLAGTTADAEAAPAFFDELQEVCTPPSLESEQPVRRCVRQLAGCARLACRRTVSRASCGKVLALTAMSFLSCVTRGACAGGGFSQGRGGGERPRRSQPAQLCAVGRALRVCVGRRR